MGDMASHLRALALALAIAAGPLWAGASEESRPQRIAKAPTQLGANLEERGETEDVAAAKPGHVPGIRYTPPPRGAPRTRTSGGTRAVGPELAVVALAPAHVARTVQPAPDLFWYLDAPPPTGARVVFTLIDEESIDPVAHFELTPLQTPGIQRVDLAGRGVELAMGLEYEWSVSVVVDPDKRAHDIVGRGWLRRMPAKQLDAETSSASLLAGLSLWYDALERLSDQIDAAPEDRGLREQRADLLRQVDLAGAVAEASTP